MILGDPRPGRSRVPRGLRRGTRTLAPRLPEARGRGLEHNLPLRPPPSLTAADRPSSRPVGQARVDDPGRPRASRSAVASDDELNEAQRDWPVAHRMHLNTEAIGALRPGARQRARRRHRAGADGRPRPVQSAGARGSVSRAEIPHHWPPLSLVANPRDRLASAGSTKAAGVGVGETACPRRRPPAARATSKSMAPRVTWRGADRANVRQYGSCAPDLEVSQRVARHPGDVAADVVRRPRPRSGSRESTCGAPSQSRPRDRAALAGTPARAGAPLARLRGRPPSVRASGTWCVAGLTLAAATRATRARRQA